MAANKINIRKPKLVHKGFRVDERVWAKVEKFAQSDSAGETTNSDVVRYALDLLFKSDAIEA